ncbi:MAG: aminoacyl-histidine dipeptidase [Gemmatimonadales bacterium]|nr:Succinyl-diaminopimelate desuccinylase [bacterium HR33]GIW50792.1 MAG: aminoacyl-histidine dipeptidase [Gemmatimonadales bacterium]
MNRLLTVLMAAFLLLPPALSAQGRPVSYDEQIRSIAMRPEVRRAFAVIEQIEPRSREDLIRLTEIPAPPFKEETRARAYAEMLRQAGADSVWIDAEGNVIALKRGRSRNRTVAMAGHLDTVFPEGTDVTVKIRGDTLYAPGIGDDTRGLVVVLNVLRAINQAPIVTEADVLFIGTVGEEGLGDLRGVKHLFGSSGPRIDAFIAVDGGSPERIVHQGIGSKRYRVTFRGPGGHSWGAFGLANPHHALGAAIYHFVQEADRYTRQGPRTSYNVGVLSGGTSVNAIPFESVMEVDMRSVSPERLAGIDSIFHRAVRRALEEQNSLRRSGPALTVEVELVGDRPSGVLDPSTPIVQRAMAAARYLGLEPSLESGSTDSNIPIARGLPAITIGRGGVGGGAHSPGEWWLPRNPDLATKNALLILLAEAGVAGSR